MMTYTDRLFEARLTGQCMDCEQPVAGRVGWATRCETHRQAARKRAVRGWEIRNREHRRHYWRQYKARTVAA